MFFFCVSLPVALVCADAKFLSHEKQEPRRKTFAPPKSTPESSRFLIHQILCSGKLVEKIFESSVSRTFNDQLPR